MKPLVQNGVPNPSKYRLQIATLYTCLSWYKAVSPAALQQGLGTHLVRLRPILTATGEALAGQTAEASREARVCVHTARAAAPAARRKQERPRHRCSQRACHEGCHQHPCARQCCRCGHSCHDQHQQMREVEGTGLEAAPAGAHPAVSASKHISTQATMMCRVML